MAAKPLPYANQAVEYLSRVDPVMARIIREVGPYQIARRRERFQALVRAIIFQQLAGAAAQTILERFVGLYPDVRFPRPERILATSDQAMRSVGLSRQKMSYIRDLARHVAEDRFNFRALVRMEDELIIEQLTQVRGIGRWTAEMFLMFNLGRPDVLPVDDLGFRNAVVKAYRMRKVPTPKALRKFGERWRPYRSVAVWYLWQSLRLTLLDGRAGTARVKKIESGLGA